VHAQVAVAARHHLRLEGVVAQQAQRIHCLEAELLCLKQLLVGGSPLVAARPGAPAATPATGQRFYDAESGERRRLAAQQHTHTPHTHTHTQPVGASVAARLLSRGQAKATITYTHLMSKLEA
jgi:hypothetical protein